MTDTPAPENADTEAHGLRRGWKPVEVAAHGMNVRLPDEDDSTEAEAHWFRRDPSEGRYRDPAETEAHGWTLGTMDPAIEAYARLALSFPADAPAQTFELRYTPAEKPGDQPEVELHYRLH